MKKKTKILLYALFMLIINFTFGQTPWITTGNTTTGGEKMGSASGNFDLEFYINNAKFLQVLTSGDLNVVVGTNGYKIDNEFVLSHNNRITNIYVGVGAGNTNATN